METTQTSTIASKDSRSAWRKTDTMWMLGLYGTAIGAGVLFLPINAGVGGMIPLIIMAILAFPMTFFAHRGLTRFVLSGKNPGEDITEVVEEHFGIGAGKLITLLYFFAIYPILLVYSVAITNTVESFMSHQPGMTPPPRAILSLILIVGMMTIVRFGEQMIVKAMSILVFPFVGVLMLLAADLIEKLSAQLVNQATEYSQALKNTTEQRDMLMGTQDKLAALLSYVTGGRFSKTSYSIDEMERFVDDYQQSECAKCDELERVKVEHDAVPQWISVKDRLPEESEDVLVFCRNDNITWNTIAHRVRTLWWRSGVPIESVTHWMPLPEAPRKRKS